MKSTYKWLWAVGLMVACAPKTKVSQSPSVQEEPEYLLTVGNENVPAEEFLYMLSKNRNFDQPEVKLSKDEFEENFNLFIDYKLKVKEAEALGMDQSEEFKREFDAFKDDLKKPYLLETSLQEGEVRKAYSRMQEVLDASHILLRFPPNSSNSDSIAVYKMAVKLKERALEGEDFSELAEAYSQDPSVSTNHGNLGYFTSLQMVAAFEDAAYQLQPGQVSDPVLTEFGYHIIYLKDRKPNPGQIRVSHILVRIDPADPVSLDRARRKITDIYTALQRDDTSWEEVCRNFSEDTGTKDSQGTLPWFGVGSFIKEFEEAAFSLKEIGEVSSPVKTDFGYHILRLEDTKPLPPYAELEKSIQSKVLRDSRSGLIQSQVTAIQKSKYNYRENENIIHQVRYSLKEGNDALPQARQLLAEKNLMDSTLFTIQNEQKTVGELVDFIELDEAVVKKSKLSPFDSWLNKFIEVSLDQKEEEDLMANNEDYRLLIKEYRDGILLFDLMNEMVWQKALTDTTGLMEFFEQHRDQYQWQDRTDALIVTLMKNEASVPVTRFLEKKSYRKSLDEELDEALMDQYPLAYTTEIGTFEIDQYPVLKAIDPTPGLHKAHIDNKNYIVLLGKQYTAGPKSFEETRGKVIQDYQGFLDKNLIELLKQNYIVQINDVEKDRIQHIVVEEN